MQLLSMRSDAKTIANATGLVHFFARTGVDFQPGNQSVMYDLKGNIELGVSANTSSRLIDDSENHRFISATAGLKSHNAGTWTNWSNTDDGLFIISGQNNAASDGGTGELNTLGFWTGNGAVADTPSHPSRSIRVRAGQTQGAGQDAVFDDAYVSGAPSFGNVIRVLPNDTNAVLILAIDRTNNLTHHIMYTQMAIPSGVSGTYFGLDAASSVKRAVTPFDALATTDITTLSTITPYVTASNVGGTAFYGKICGAGAWKFPNKSLPADWQQAALEMGMSWMTGAYNFWPYW